MIIEQTLEGCSGEEARSCLYYAARYIKQAENFENYKKDIFEDEENNAPSARVREITLRLIGALEAREGMRSEQFDEETIIRLLDEITSFETGLSLDLSDSERARGASLAAGMTPPIHSSPDSEAEPAKRPGDGIES